MTRIAGATLNQTPLDWENNFSNMREAIRLAIDQQVQILCLPELCITGYGCEDLFLSDWLYEEAINQLLRIKPLCKNICVAIGVPVRLNGHRYDTTCIIRNEEIVGFYAKQNLALDGVHYEPRWFTPWAPGQIKKIILEGQTYDFGDIVLDIDGVIMGFEICEDAWRTNRPALRMAQHQVPLILNPSASHFAFGKTIDREKLVVDSSLNFNCTYVYANLLGNEAGKMIYDGEILIARNGKLVKRNNWLSFEKVQLQYADIDFTMHDEVYPEPEVYERSKNVEFLKASTLALFDYLRKSRSQGFVLSLSGGADSSTIAVLVREMVNRGIATLGVEEFIKRSGLINVNVPPNADQKRYITSRVLTCAYQGTMNSSKETSNAAQTLANELGATFYSWLIDEEVNSYTGKIEKALNRSLTWDSDDITLQNIQARTRSPIIWMLANINNALLLTTSNRSEGDVGYTTMDGDTSGSIAPIAGVDKHFIRQWLNWAEKQLNYPALAYVNNLQPSAELRPKGSEQTDESDLMPYNIIVDIEKLAIRDHRSPLEVFHTLKEKNPEDPELLKAHIKKFFRLWSRNQWKRERIAPAFHLDDFNVDPRSWCRFPILSGGFEEELRKLEER